MPSFPVPVFAALVLGFLFLRMVAEHRRVGFLAALIALCALQALIIALAQHYGVPGLRVVQAVTATFIPAFAWVAFQATAVRGWRRGDLVHAAGPFVAVLTLLALPEALDLLIPALFLGYGAAILVAVLRGADALPRLALASGDVPARLWTIIAAALIASALSDVLIFGAQLAGMGWLKPWIISVYSIANLMIVGGLSLSGALATAEDSAETPPATTAEDAEVMARLATLMAERQPYLDPDLTLTRLARKLGLPAKKLSSAINRTTGQNVSRYINDARIAAAQDALARGETVTRAMLSSGFNTKSNFNREFLRVTGANPSEWRRGQDG